MKAKTRAASRTSAEHRVKRLPTTLGRLERVQLVRRTLDDEITYSFKHALVQDTAYESLTHYERKRLHRHVAEAYETAYADRCMDEFAALLAQHYAEAGDDAKTLEYAMHAGDVAAGVYANSEAIAFYDRALQAAKRSGATTAQLVHLYTRRGRVFEVTGRDPAALATYQEMYEFARASSDRALELQALLLQDKLRSAPSVTFDRAQAIALAAQAEQLAAALGDREAQARVLWIRLVMHHYSGENAEAILYGEQAMLLARELDARELLAYILGDLARAYLYIGQMERVTALQNETRALWRALDNKPMLADNLMQSATQAMMRGELDETIALTGEGIELSRAIDSKLSLLSNQGTQQIVFVERGEFARALLIVNEILRLAGEIKLGFNVPLAYAMSAWDYGILGAFERGDRVAQTTREILNHPLPEFFRAWSWILLANYYLEREDLDAVQDALGAARVEDSIRGGGPAGIFGIIALGNYLYARGDYAGAAQRTAERVRELQHIGIKQSLSEALFIQARAVRALGDNTKTLELLEQARVVAERMQARRLLWQIYALLSEVEHERGAIERAVEYQHRARAVIEFIVANTPAEFRQSFLNLPRVRAVWAGGGA